MAKRVKEEKFPPFLKWAKELFPTPNRGEGGPCSTNGKKGKEKPRPSPQLVSAKRGGVEVVARRWFREEELERFANLLSLLAQIEEGWGVTILGLFLELWRGEELLLEGKVSHSEVARLLHRESRRLFEGVREFSSPYRRGILAEIGRLLSERLEGYHLYSPEEWEEIDPNLHIPVAGEGGRIGRGLSFIVKGEKGGTLLYGEVELDSY
ncbi:MAG: hypothetical protein ABGW77_04760 [Campylobacterales bacterium]